MSDSRLRLRFLGNEKVRAHGSAVDMERKKSHM